MSKLNPGTSAFDDLVAEFSSARPSAPVDGLPPQAARRFKWLSAEADAEINTSHDMMSLRADLDSAKGRLGWYLQKHGEAADPKEVARLRVDIATAEEAIRAYQRKTSPLVAITNALRSTTASCATHINRTQLSGFTFAAVDVKPEKGTSAEALESRLREIGHEITETEAAVPPMDHAIKQARDEIARRARKGEPRAEFVQSHGASLRRDYLSTRLQVFFPETRVNAAPLHDNQENLPTAPDAVALLCWCFEEKIADALEAQLEDMYEEYHGLALAPEEKATRLRNLRAEKLLRERELAAMLWQRIESGASGVTFPADMDPAAILGVEVIET